MKRINLTDENGVQTANWFDSDKAKFIREDQTHNGKNWISTATGSQFKHEGLYITTKKRYILNSWSDFQGSKEFYETISKSDAIEWLIKNGFSDEAEEIQKGVLENYEV